MTIRKLMRAMMLEALGQPLTPACPRTPQPGPGQVLVRVHACGVCRTDLHILDGDLTRPKLPLILGHEIAGTVAVLGDGVTQFAIGDRIGVPWLGWTCGECRFCRRGQENLCENARFTGYTLDGGYADYTVADQRYCFRLPDAYDFAEAAPLLCAGLIGYRAYRMIDVGAGRASLAPVEPGGPLWVQPAQRLGIYGFGAAAHIIAQIAVHQGRQVYAFTKPGDAEGQAFALRVGAVWAGDSTAMPPDELDAAIIFAPVGALVPAALGAVSAGGVVVCGGIHMSDIPRFPYNILWGERVVRSVANLTRQDGEELLALAPAAGVRPAVQRFTLEQANVALERLRRGQIEGAAVLVMG